MGVMKRHLAPKKEEKKDERSAKDGTKTGQAEDEYRRVVRRMALASQLSICHIHCSTDTTTSSVIWLIEVKKRR